MRLKINKDEPELTPEQQLEEKVDAMMDPRRGEHVVDLSNKQKADSVVAPVSTDAKPAIDIFSGIATAPEIPGTEKHSKKQAEASDADASTQQPEATDEPSPATSSDPEDSPAIDTEIDDAGTDAAVDNIMQQEIIEGSPEESEDTAPNAAAVKPAKKSGGKIRNFFRAWWVNAWARRLTILGIVLLLIGAAVWPNSRYMVLNTAGVRSGAMLKITDNSTGLPLKNVSVHLGEKQTKTDEKGVAKFTQVRLGTQDLLVERVAFAPINKKITIGWGSNPLGSIGLKATGAQYEFNVNDYLSTKPVSAEAVSGEASAFSDKKGKIVITVDDPKTDTVNIEIQAQGYRTEKLEIPASSKEKYNIRMVAGLPIVYVSKQSGKYDLYKVDVDGKNKKLLLAGTGRERQNMAVATSPDGKQAALVSSRGTKRDKSGYLLDTLTLIDMNSGSATSLDEAQNIKLVDWVGKRLVYTASYAAPSAATSDRQRIVSYDIEESARAVLAMSDYFNGIVSHEGYVYYAIASSDPKQPSLFARNKLDGTSKQQTLLDKQVWTIQRGEYASLALETPDGWFDYRLGDKTAQKGNPPSESFVTRQYFVLPGSNKSLWLDNRDGKGVLLMHQENNSKDVVIASASGVTVPLRWLSSNTVLYRVKNSNETAEYVKSLDGGEAKKITNATDVAGLNTSY